MEPILAILVAGPLGYLTATRRRGIVIYLAAYYLFFNALILTGGLTLNQLGSVLRARRHRRVAPRRTGALGAEKL